ncbi:MAG: ATP-binding protein [Anaerolineales bacterium]
MAWTLSLRLMTEPQALRIARKLVSSAATAEGASAIDSADIEVAVGETLMNAHFHAYGEEPGPLTVTVEFDGLRLVVVISDNGKMVAEGPSVPTHLPPPGEGRGLYLIGRLMDDVNVIPSATGRPGIAVRMVKRIR